MMIEEVDALNQPLADPAFPHITHRRGASRQPVAVLRGTGIRVQTIAVAGKTWGLSVAQIAAEYDLDEPQIREALAFYKAHRRDIDAAIAAEDSLVAKTHR